MRRKSFVILLLTLTLLAALAAGCTTAENTTPEAQGEAPIVVDSGDATRIPELPGGEAITPGNAGSLEPLQEITLETESLTYADWSADSTLIAAVTSVGVFLVDTSGEEPPISLNPTGPSAETSVGEAPDIPAGRVSFVPGQAILAVESATPGEQVTLWDVSNPYEPTTATLDELNELAEGAARVAFTAEGQLMATASAAEPNMVRVWNLETGDVWLEIDLTDDLSDQADADGIVERLTFSPDSSQLAVRPSVGANVLIYDVSEGQSSLAQNFSAEGLFDEPEARPEIGPEWNTLAWISRGTVVLMDMETGEELQRFEHEDFINTAAFTPDGALLATSSAETIDGELQPVLKLWDTQTGEDVATLTGFAGIVQALAFSDDNTLMATGSGGGNLMLWGIRE